ncbi:MAG: TVP38/TMEM64 family protein [Paracoccaceae bacterium]
MTDTTRETGTGRRRPAALRWLPIAVIAIGAVLGVVFLRDYLSFETLVENRDALLAWRADNAVAAAAVFVAAYALATAFSVPGAIWFTITGGFLFGTILGTALSVTGATIGAVAVFLAARTSLGESLKASAGPWLDRMRRGFQEGEVSFLLIMRLVPVVPFWIANLAPAFLGTRLATFAWTTFLGIIPGAAVYSSVGNGVGALIDDGEKPDLGAIFDPAILGPLLGLAALAALPVVVRRLRGRPAA